MPTAPRIRRNDELVVGSRPDVDCISRHQGIRRVLNRAPGFSNRSGVGVTAAGGNVIDCATASADTPDWSGQRRCRKDEKKDGGEQATKAASTNGTCTQDTRPSPCAHPCLLVPATQRGPPINDRPSGRVEKE